MIPFKLFEEVHVGPLTLRNRIVMAPMTRCRAIGHIPTELMISYYQQRAKAGLIITEGTAPTEDGLGYARIPGIYNWEQLINWRKVTNAVHDAGGKIFIQLMHCGRIAHPLNMPKDAVIMAPSAIQASGEIWTDQQQMQAFIIPKAMTAADINTTKRGFLSAAKNAMIARFDGVELHGANGYLLEQFLSPHSNTRTDEYGGSVANRCKFLLEVVAAVADGIGKEKTGVRLSPYGVASDMPAYPEIEETYAYLSKALHDIGIAYIHLVDHSAMGAPQVPLSIKKMIRKNFGEQLILSGGYDGQSAERDITPALADMIAFGRPFINNPDLVERLAHGWPLATSVREDLFYTSEAEGYTDYPAYQGAFVEA